ncbi:AsmA family protein [Cupriavidus sp. SZY C1]|uniref:AsmA family protein n=1 Tax=Cupriavidus sp. SZY C1 TaxID=3055037 RepID=UPI0028BA9AD9|nr:AsmA family protein [Cupriavidus sp. SZY C1]MDT6960270.1 AsmA family protein [Cupriavidus sp. SZY C1]
MPASRRQKIVFWSVFAPLALITLVVIVILTFDWNRLKPWLNDKVSESIGRPFAINGDLSVTWKRPQGETGWRTLVPWPRLSGKDITIGNPDWAEAPNMGTIRELIFILRPLPLLAHEINVPTIVVDSPAVWLERLADKRNNWTFDTRKETDSGKSKWHLDVGEVVLQRGNLALKDAAEKIDLQATLDTIGDKGIYDKARDGALMPSDASAVAASQAAAASAASAPDARARDNKTGNDDRYGLRWKAVGHYNQATINATGKAGTVLSLRDTNTPYPIQADVRVGATRATIEGTVTNPAHLGALDVNLALSGDSMASLYKLTGIVLPSTPPYETRGRLVATLNKGASTYTYRNFTGKVGGSDIGGTLTFAQRSPRPLLSGELVSKQLLFADLAPLIGGGAKPGEAAKDSPVKQPPNKALPVAPFRTERWDEIDADVKFTGKRIVRDEDLPITDLTTHLKLTDGVLLLDPLNFGVAGGNLVSTIRLDGKREPMGAMIDMTARHLKIKQLFPKADSARASVGEINGSAKLSATGNSVAQILGSSNGEARLLVENGTVSKFILEAIGLNVGSVVVSKLFGDKPVQINCGVAAFGFQNGIARAQTFVLDTQDAVINTEGAVDFKDERLALTIHPDSKGLRIISLRSPLYVGGTFKDPSVSPNIAILALRAGGALALALTAPVAMVVPLLDISGGEESNCGKLLAELKKRPTAPPPGKTYTGPSAGKGQQQAGPAIPESPTKSDAARGEPAPEPTKPRIPAPNVQQNRPANDRQLYQGG